MSLAVRVIPCLDVDAGRVVKGVMQETRSNSPRNTTARARTN